MPLDNMSILVPVFMILSDCIRRTSLDRASIRLSTENRR